MADNPNDNQQSANEDPNNAGTGEETTPPEPQGSNDGAEGSQPQGGDSQTAGDADGDAGLGELPEWAQTEMKRLRRENATRRTKNNELEQRIANAESLEDKAALADQLSQELEAERRSNLVSKALLEHGLPETASVMLSGTDAETIGTQAQFLASLQSGRTPATPPPLPPRGGVNPNQEPEPDFAELARLARSRR